jgi:ribosome-interacting GTPase 1
MPANLSPEYFEADRQYRQASSDEERLAALQRMLSAIPKHKGTEKLQADLKTRISKLRSEVKRGGGKTRQYDPSFVRREGAGQVALVGAPNAGKSALAAAVTNAKVEVAEYPFSTQKPQPAMVAFENIQIQLVDTPAVSRDYTPGWLSNLVRNADAALLVVDAGDEACLEHAEMVIDVLGERHVKLVRERNATDHAPSAVACVPTLLAPSKMDLPGAEDRLEILREFFGDRFEVYPYSTQDERRLNRLRRLLFDRLGVIRVCTKAPGRPPATDHPFVLPVGATVLDLARQIHKDVAETMQFARIWGDGKYSGQRVNRDHELQDMDILEIHC